MARPRTGIGFLDGGTLYTGIRDGKRRATWPVVDTDPPPAGVALGVPWARAVSLARQAAYDRGEWAPRQWQPKREPDGAPPAGETFGAWFARYSEARRAAGLRSVRSDGYRYGKHIAPILGPLPVAAIGPREVSAVRDALDEKIQAGELTGKTAANVWSVLTTAFKKACSTKQRRTGLYVRADNPCVGVEPPDATDPREGPYLYPSEWLQLAACEAVDLEMLRAAAVCVYQYLRAGEADALRPEDVDLEHWTVSVVASIDNDTRETIEPKTRAGVRTAPIEPAARPLFAFLVERARREGRERLLSMGDRRDLATNLRAALVAAGCTRAALYADDAARHPMWWHDLRATGITWATIRGDDDAKITRRAGHADRSHTERYKREAEHLGPGVFGPVFPPIPARLAGGFVGSSVGTPPVTEGNAGELRCEEGELNPGPGSQPTGNAANRSGDPDASGTQASGSVGGFVGSLTLPEGLRRFLALPLLGPGDAAKEGGAPWN
jgi:integrase